MIVLPHKRHLARFVPAANWVGLDRLWIAALLLQLGVKFVGDRLPRVSHQLHGSLVVWLYLLGRHSAAIGSELSTLTNRQHDTSPNVIHGDGNTLRWLLALVKAECQTLRLSGGLTTAGHPAASIATACESSKVARFPSASRFGVFYFVIYRWI